MANPRVLGNLDCGQEAVVSRVNGTSAVMMRLMEIGLIPGRTVSVVRRAAFGGPMQLQVDQTRVAVRTADAGCVEITETLATTQPQTSPVRETVTA